MSHIDHTHDREASSWIDGADEHPDFPVQNLPLGIFSLGDGQRRVGTAIGDSILDLSGLSRDRLLPDSVRPALETGTLNALFALSSAERQELRHGVFASLTDRTSRVALLPHLYPSQHCTMHLPFTVGDYTDFYVGIHHATNIGRQFRPDNPLLPNYKYVPIGYHGRASSIRLSGTPVIRPKGQHKPSYSDLPGYGPTYRLDYELELGVWIAGENALGEPVPISKAGSRVGGLCLLNDWSARDLQAWEYQPLGPFLAKNFLTSVSPWVVTAEALAPFRIAQPARPEDDPAPLPYLFDATDQAEGAFALTLETWIATRKMREAGMPPHRLGTGPATSMYWTVAQMVTHHTANGCNLMPGDLLGTGTISTPDPSGLGSLMELSQGGKAPVTLPDGEERSFLEDGDELILSARAVRDGFRSIGFGLCSGVVEAART
ncbi:fumarylacetoacetase [Sphingorhabdus lacus]|uniref:fumarylacetoacetase n=1 Tax=Sphingorhabdus lacus TaxID=392610 RepID=A0A6I6L3X6_9SPHN|nr:fumarylacetoacetase [Sphingorhabdus lacus]QGY80740.1 fumarylacetoacetase [Sphingorhabdus lacus]